MAQAILIAKSICHMMVVSFMCFGNFAWDNIVWKITYLTFDVDCVKRKGC